MSGHVAPIRHYLLVFLVLMVLTATTVVVAFVDLGWLNDLVAMAIAVTKATLVILIFMHVKNSSRMSKITVISSFLWLAILIGLTLADYLTRGFLPSGQAWPG